MHSCDAHLHTLLVALALASFVCQEACALRLSSPPKLSADISQWNYTWNVLSISPQRFWDAGVLQRGMAVMQYEQMEQVVDKLQRGLPLTVAAIGDSIVATHGGCYHRDEEHLAEYIGPDTGFYENTHYCAPKNKHQNPARWLAGFMSLINTTWPHKDHVLINLGMPGMTFYSHSESTCLEAMLPRSTDLIIIENLGDLHGPQIHTMGSAMERALMRMQLYFKGKMPAMIFINMHFLIPDEDEDMVLQGQNCINKPKLCSSKECTDVFSALPRPRHSITNSERILNDMARYYGMASISHTALMHVLIRDGVHLRINMSRCELFSMLFKDRVHPGPTGKLLLADLLTSYLAASERYFAQQASDPLHKPDVHTGLVLPEALLFPRSHLIPRMRCYRAIPRSRYSSAAAAADAASWVTSINAVQAKGFEYKEWDGEAGAFKPGWVATTAGAILHVEIDTDFWCGVGIMGCMATNQSMHSPARSSARRLAEAGAADAAANATAELGRDDTSSDGNQQAGAGKPAAAGKQAKVLITYLKSYEHMGRATVWCFSGCSCEATVIEGHQENGMHSIPVLHEMMVSASKQCVLAIRVLKPTSSGEHKFKVMQVAAIAQLDASQQLQALRVQGLARVGIKQAGVSDVSGMRLE